MRSFSPKLTRPDPELDPRVKVARARLRLIEAARNRETAKAAGSFGERGWGAFNPYLKEVTPDWSWDWPHLVKMQETLEGIINGTLRKVMFFVPPRHGKTEQNTVRFAAYCIENDPRFRVIIWAYNQTLASKFSRKVKRIVTGRVDLSHERKASEEWETTEGGGVRAAGVGVGVTGMGANLILIDDPVKSREEAESEAYRERVWGSYGDDLFTRLEPGGAIALTMTRWHEDDLAARILDSEDGPNWHVVSMPAIAEDQADRDEWARKHKQLSGQPDPLGRQPGEALCPNRYPLDELLSIKRVLGSYGFSALYQQRPTPAGGGMFPVTFPIVEMEPPGCAYVRYWDKAGTEGGGCYTAGVLMARSQDNRYFVVDVVRGQWSSGNREKVIKDTATLDGTHVHVWLEQEPGSGGKESAETTIINLAGFFAQKENVTGDKETRARPLAAQAEIGNIYVKRGEWNRAFIDEAKSFPSGKYKDQVDAAGGAFNKLALIPMSPGVSVASPRPQIQPTPPQQLIRPAMGIPGGLSGGW